MAENHKRRIEHFQEAMRAIGRRAVEEAQVPGTEDQVFCRCHETTCRAAWIGPVDSWSRDFGISWPGDQHFVVRLCPDHDTPERRAAIDAKLQADLGWRAEAWDRLWTKLLSSTTLAQPRDDGDAADADE
jgi:hypothetical protein